MRPAEGGALADRIRAFILGESEEPFGLLALDVHRYQVAHSAVHAALATDEPETWRDIPAVPVDLFKRLAVGTVPEGRGVVFRTSGTTAGRRGAHRVWSTDLYDLGAARWAHACVPDLPSTAHALLLDPTEHVDSSLSHMVTLLAHDITWHLHADGLDVHGLQHALSDADGPVFLPATAFALAEWFERGTPAAPEGSVVMVTGGFKGRIHRLDADDLAAALAAALPGARLVGEYGMSELSSQLWGDIGHPFRPPPWLHVIAVDPSSGRTLPSGSAGQLRFVDLCNLDSALAIETLDAGVVHPDGAVTLHGRLPGAVLRGCSLTVEEAWSRRARREAP